MNEKLEETKTENPCPRCKKKAKLFYTYKNNPLCKECLRFVLSESRKTLNSVRDLKG